MIIIGLGNPGPKYKNTRHNIGFRIVDKFAKENDFPDFKLSKKLNCLISESIFKNKKVLLAKPQTFMNESGIAVKKITPNIKYQISNIIVLHDDIDLALGKIKIVKSRGSAGHKGVESVIKEMGNKNFIRLRIGIKPSQTNRPISKAEDFVLKKFSKAEEKILKQVIEKSLKAIESLITNGLEKTTAEFN